MIVAQKAVLWSPENKKVSTWFHVEIDSCSSHTEIHKQHETITLLDGISSIDIVPHKCTIYFNTGYYLIIIK